MRAPPRLRPRCLPVLLLIALLALPSVVVAEPRCEVPAELVPDELRLPALVAQLKDKKPVTIVAIGGSSTAGVAVRSPTDADPQRLQEALQQRYPGVAIRVLNKGMPHQNTEEVRARLEADAIAEKPDLVLWEAGTIEAARGFDVENFAAALADGLQLLRSHHIETILINMQYSRHAASLIDFAPYLDAMRRAAELDEVYLFPRFELMHAWSDAGVFDFDDVPKGERAAVAARLYDCLAHALSDVIGTAAP